MSVNDMIRNLRKETGMTRKDFAEHFGIPLRTIEDWEAERRIPPDYIPRLLSYQWKYEQMIMNKNSLENRNVSIVVDAEGQKVVVIQDIIFKNKQNIVWDDVEKYLEQYVGKMYSIVDDNTAVYIGKDLPDEYAHSKYSAKLKGALAKAKANAAQAIPEMIEISSNGTYSDNMEERHRLNAKFGWYRYDSRFAVAVYNNDGEIERYNIFKARMIIRHDSNGKKYLYDIINIKKEPSTPLG